MTKCSNRFCNNEAGDELYCLRCESIMSDAMLDNRITDEDEEDEE